MKILDALAPITWSGTPVAMRELRSALQFRGVTVSMTESCLHTFAQDAVDAARETPRPAREHPGFSERLHEEVERRADFIRDWTPLYWTQAASALHVWRKAGM